MKSNLEIFIEVLRLSKIQIDKNPACKRGKLYSGIIDEVNVEASTGEWSKYWTAKTGVAISKSLVSARCAHNDPWHELAATCCPSGYKKKQAYKIAGIAIKEIDKNKAVKHNKKIANNWLSGVRI